MSDIIKDPMHTMPPRRVPLATQAAPGPAEQHEARGGAGQTEPRPSQLPPREPWQLQPANIFRNPHLRN